jgi:hypothetical protein
MNKIKWVTQAIAQSCDIQKSLFPDFVNVADELAIEWEMALDELNDPNTASLITDQQLNTIKKLDDYILSISGSNNIQYWNDIALCQSKEWQRIREMAIDILSIMKWEKIVPSKSKAIYINHE